LEQKRYSGGIPTGAAYQTYFASIVAEVSQFKTPIPKAIIDRPMRVLRERAQQEFEQAKKNYEAELNNWKAAKKEEDRGPAPEPPRLRVYSFDKTTGEGIIYQQAAYPNQAMMSVSSPPHLRTWRRNRQTARVRPEKISDKP
jgi:hypothetical protein